MPKDSTDTPLPDGYRRERRWVRCKHIFPDNETIQRWLKESNL